MSSARDGNGDAAASAAAEFDEDFFDPDALDFSASLQDFDLDLALSAEDLVPGGGLGGSGDAAAQGAAAAAAAPAATMTIVQRLQQTWLNERGAPEILPYSGDLVDSIRIELDARQASISSGGGASGPDGIVSNIYQMELDRIKFVLHEYLRIRLRKIEKYAIHVLGSEAHENLSPQEKEFAAGYLDILEAHLQRTFLQHIPERYRGLNDPGMVPTPDLNSHVLVRVREPLELSVGPDDDAILLNPGDVMPFPYIDFRPLVLEDKVELI